MNRYIIILLLLILVTHIFWFLPIWYLTYWDAWILWKAYLHWVFSSPIDFWLYEKGFIRPDLLYFPILYLFSIFSELGIDYMYFSRFLLYIPSVILFPLWIFLILRKFNSEFSSFLWALFALFNTYFLQLQTWHIFISLSWWLSTLWLYYSLLEKNYYKSSLFYILSLMIDIRITYIFLLIHIFYLFALSTKNIKKDLLSILTIFIPIVIWTWFVLFATSWTNAISSIVDRWIFWDWLFDFAHAFTISHPMWTLWEPILTFTKQWLAPYSFFVLFIFIAWSLLIKNKKYYYFVWLFLIWVFLTKQNSYPFVWSYSWLSKNIPLFSTYRESSKFFWISLMWFIPIIAIFFDKIWELPKKILYLFSTIFIISLLYTASPLFNFKVWTVFIPRYSYLEADNFNKKIVEDSTKWNFLQFPDNSRWLDYNQNHLIWDNNIIHNYFKCLYTNEKCKKIMYSELSKNNIKYIIIPKDYEIWWDLMFKFYQNLYWNRENIIKRLDRVFPKKDNSSNKDFVIYKIY